MANVSKLYAAYKAGYLGSNVLDIAIVFTLFAGLLFALGKKCCFNFICTRITKSIKQNRD